MHSTASACSFTVGEPKSYICYFLKEGCGVFTANAFCSLSCAKIYKERMVSVTEKIVITVVKEYKATYTYSTYNRYGPGEISRYIDSLRAGWSGDRIPMGGEIFRTLPDRPWGPPSLLYNGYRVFSRG